MKSNRYPAEIDATNLDTDWVYRKAGPRLISGIGVVVSVIDTNIRKGLVAMIKGFVKGLQKCFNDHGLMGRAWSTSTMAVWATLILGLCLMLYYF
jgi:multicomponent Na+:H+ antiporter subunit D